MYLSDRHIKNWDENLDDLCFRSKNLYNITNYTIRQHFFVTGKIIGAFDLMTMFRSDDQIDFRSLPIQSSNGIIIAVCDAWKSYFKAKKEYDKYPDKFTGKPKIPKYKHKTKGRNVVSFTNQQCFLRDGYIVFPKTTNIEPIKTKVDNIHQVRIVPNHRCFVIEIIYEKKEEVNLELDSSQYLAIDCGVNNLATCVSSSGKTLLLNGRAIKSINQYYNKALSDMVSKEMINQKTEKIEWTNRMYRLLHKRNMKIQDYMHKASRNIIDYCVEHKIGNIVIGHNKGWKQEVNIGKRNNQNFVQIPINKFISMVQYKGRLVGINVIIVEESYTSKIDHFALEPMKHHANYLGKRKKRGLFQSSTGRLVNADVNGAIGILRKVVGDSGINQIINRGFTDNPLRVKISSDWHKSVQSKSDCHNDKDGL